MRIASASSVQGMATSTGRVTELERFDLLPRRIKKIVEEVAVWDEAGRREPAVQDWLCRVKRIAAIIPSTTQSSFASGKTIEGLLPPSSSDTGTMRSEAARMMSLPTSVEPVKESLFTIGWFASGAPHS